MFQEFISALLTAVLTAIISGILILLLTRKINKRDANKEAEQQAALKKEKDLCDRLAVQETAIKGLLHNSLYRATGEYLTQKWCSQADKENLNMMFIPYKDFGMNGACKAQVEKCLTLPNNKPTRRKSDETA